MKAIHKTGRFAALFLALCVMMTAFLGTVSFVADRLLADSDGDGIVTALDASLILRYTVGLTNMAAVGSFYAVISLRRDNAEIEQESLFSLGAALHVLYL